MSFLAPGELDRVWVLLRIDWEETDIIGIYSTKNHAEVDRLSCEVKSRRPRDDEFLVEEIELDADLKEHYWWDNYERLG